MGDTFGYNGALGWGKETSAWATLAARAKFIEVTNCSFTPRFDRKESPSTRGRTEKRRQDFLQAWDGACETEFIYEGLEQILEQLLGSAATAVLGGSATAKTHTFTLTDTAPNGLSVEFNRGDSAAAQTALYAGGVLTSATFKFSPNDPVMVTLN